MRDPERITQILYLLGDIWNEAPDLRLGQIIFNAGIPRVDIFYVEDDEVIKKLQAFRNNLKNAGREHKS